MRLLKQSLLLFSAAALGSLLTNAVVSADVRNKVAQFDEISAKRINIVEPNGRPRLILAGSERLPGLIFEGREYRHHSRTGGGMWFYNDDGDEVGGLSYRSGANRTASAGLTFDQYKSDQTVSMLYRESNGQREAGMRVWDLPNASMGPLLEMSDRAARASSDAERQRIRGEMEAYSKAAGGGGERLFSGKIQRDAIVRLSDPQGRPRLVMRVDASGVPSIEFLDETGKAVRRISGEGA